MNLSGSGMKGVASQNIQSTGNGAIFDANPHFSVLTRPEVSEARPQRII